GTGAAVGSISPEIAENIPVYPVPELVNVHGTTTEKRPIPQIPDVLPNNPTYSVPANPLLPPGYQEILTYEDLQYMNGFLRTQIGREARVDFLVGSTQIVSKVGKLLAVGLSYILLQDLLTGDVVVCDYFNIKFVTFAFDY
ncbi:MAG: hypothetical protein Q4C22_03425, partial [Bacillota bacterium]|nr:hypothetical protein [Bacillota bacterium]